MLLSGAALFAGQGFRLLHAAGKVAERPQSPHFHHEYLISTRIRGEGPCRVGPNTHDLSPGRLLLINPQQVHAGGGVEHLEYVSLYVDPDAMMRVAEELGAPSGHLPEFTTVITPESPDAQDRLTTLLELLSAAPDDPPGDRPLRSEIILHGLVAEVLESHSNLRLPRQLATNRVGHRGIARALDRLRVYAAEGAGTEPSANEGADPISLDALAEAAELSKFHFLREFHRRVGMTPIAFLRNHRICSAARLLRSTALPIAQIAQNVGFEDHPSFSRAFRRQLGVSPRQYRRTLRA